MKNKDNFIGFNFDTIWDISSDINDGYPYLRNMPVMPHTHSWGAWSIITEPTKTTTGVAQRICSDDNGHIDTKVLPVLTYTSVWTEGEYVAPTCDTNGSQTYTSEYGTVTETIPATGHSWGEWEHHN